MERYAKLIGDGKIFYFRNRGFAMLFMRGISVGGNKFEYSRNFRAGESSKPINETCDTLIQLFAKRKICI